MSNKTTELLNRKKMQTQPKTGKQAGRQSEGTPKITNVAQFSIVNESYSPEGKAPMVD